MTDENSVTNQSILRRVKPVVSGVKGAKGADWSKTEQVKPLRYDDGRDDQSVPNSIVGNLSSKDRMVSDSLQAQMAETTNEMPENINKVTQRLECLDSLQSNKNDEEMKTISPTGNVAPQPKSDEMQTNLDTTEAILRQNIYRVNQRGEHRLMYGTGPDDAKLSEHAKIFYLEAKKRQNEGLLTKCYRVFVEGISQLGNENYKLMQRLYEAGSHLFPE